MFGHKDVPLDACLSVTAKTEKEELVLRIYKFILQIHVEKRRVFSKEYQSLYSEFDLQVKFWGYVFETYFGNNPNILLHWGDTMSSACKNINLRFKLDLRPLVWKEDPAIFDGGTGEVAKKATTAKLYSDRLKSVMATKCHLNEFLTSATYLKESIVTEVRFPVVQIMGLDAHLCTMRLKAKNLTSSRKFVRFPSLSLCSESGLEVSKI
ncbi:unnamed protein product [Mucor hiemalis]